MKLPYLEKAIIPEAKIVRYLLNEAHPTGKDKTAFFIRFGFSVAQWEILRQALLDHVQTHEVAAMLETEEGVHYTVEGDIQTPDGRDPIIRAVWAIDSGSEVPRFITAYPLKRKGEQR